MGAFQRPTWSLPPLSCPLCTFETRISDALVQHVETYHREEDCSRRRIDKKGAEKTEKRLPSPIVPAVRSPSGTRSRKETALPQQTSDAADPDYVLCPRPDCGEAILLNEIEEHTALHEAEAFGLHDDDFGERSDSLSTAGADGSTDDSSEDEQLSKHHGVLAKPSGKEAASSRHSQSQTKAVSREGGVRRRRRMRASTGERRSGDAQKLLNRHKSVARSSRDRVSSAGSGASSKGSLRLGKSELGPYAYEDRMPSWLHKQLAEGGKVTVVNKISRSTGRIVRNQYVENEHQGLIYAMAKLSVTSAKAATIDALWKQASVRSKDGLTRQPVAPTEIFLCHPGVANVGKTPKEGGFCGYRNIQMILSHIINTQGTGSEALRRKMRGRACSVSMGSSSSSSSAASMRIPGVLTLQDWIEEAWDKGINSLGREQTGGIRGTRKFIGTPEAEAMCRNIGIPCRVNMFHDRIKDDVLAHELLLQWVEAYFRRGASTHSYVSPAPGHEQPAPSSRSPLRRPSFRQRPSMSPASSSSSSRTSRTTHHSTSSRSSASTTDTVITSPSSSTHHQQPPLQPSTSPTITLHRTSLPPIYLQQPGHSITIVGLESRPHPRRPWQSATNLLVFDPLFRPSEGIRELALCSPDISGGGGEGVAKGWGVGTSEVIPVHAPGITSTTTTSTSMREHGRAGGGGGGGGSVKGARSDKLLKVHRRGRRELVRHEGFEVLALC